MMKIKKLFYLFILIVTMTGCNTSNTKMDSSSINSENSTANNIVPNRVNNTEVNERVSKMEEEKAISWYIRLQAEDMSKKIISSNAQLGVLDEENAIVKHTLSALPPLGSDYIDIVFNDPIGGDSGEYQTSFQQFSENSEYRWGFTVKTDNTNAQIALTWRGLYVLSGYVDDQGRQRYKERRSMTNPLIINMQLIDVDTGHVMNVLSGTNAKVYYFNMNGKTEKRFEWVVLPDNKLPSSESKS